MTLVFLSICSLFLPLCGQEKNSPVTAALPFNLITELCVQLCRNAGTPSVHNEEDIPVINRYIQRMTCVCKGWNKEINDTLCTQSIIQALCIRFNIYPSEAAFSVKTRGTHQWLEKYITDAELPTFTATWELFKMLSKEQLAEMPHNFEPNFCHFHTQQGIVLEPLHGKLNTDYFLYTPWGYFQWQDCNKLPSVLVKENKQAGIVIEKLIDPASDKELFEIVSVNNRTIPEFQPLVRQRNFYTLSRIWGLLKKMAFPEQTKKRKTTTAPALEITDTSPSIPMDNLANLPDFLITILNKLENQPIIQPQSTYYKPYKLFPLAERDSRLSGCISSLIRSHFDYKLYILSTYGLESYDFRVIERHGIIFLDHPDTQLSPSGMNTLKDICVSVVNKLKNGWRFSSLTENPYIFHKQSEEEYYLLLKDTKSFELELDFIAMCAHKFGLLHNPQYMSCFNTWKEPGKGSEQRDPLYLWIKKETFKKVVQIFGFEIANLPSQLS
jgi:hypothetical protein